MSGAGVPRAERALGVDCGGSKCRAEWWPPGAGPAVAGPGVQPAVQGIEAAAAPLAGLLRTAAAGAAPAACVVAMAGVADRATAARVTAALHSRGVLFPVTAVADVLAATAGALGDGPGLLVWSGTGSFAIARGRDGRLHRAGGRGFLLSDQGSGYDLVRRAAAAAVLACDGLAPATTLGKALGNASGVLPERLGAALQQLDSGAVAALLPVVLGCDEAGDLIAGQILDEGADALAAVAGAAVRAAHLDWSGLRTVLGGGVLTHADTVRERVQRRLVVRGAHRRRRRRRGRRARRRAAGLGRAAVRGTAVELGGPCLDLSSCCATAACWAGTCSR
jgi:N-acetylglucosamine kinase-like BadF-type ATPase